MIQIKNEYKTIQFALYFSDYDEKDTRVYRFLLPKLIISHSKKYQTKSKMQKHLEDLYGARLYARSERHANLNVMSFNFTIVEPKIVEDKQLLKQSIALLNDLFIDRDFFSETIFEEEKRLLIEQWESIKDHKRSYAHVEFSKLFYKNDLSGYPMSGTLNDIKKLKLEDLIDYYHKVVLNNDLKIVINGHIELYMDDIMRDLKIKPLEKSLDINFKFRNHKLNHIKEEKTKMNQAIIKLGFLYPIYRFDELYEAALCVDTMLGGYPDSRLFKEIREKQGLCYDISSDYDFYKGGLLISSGVASHQKDHALKAIINEVTVLKNDGVSLDELNQAKAYLIHQIKSSLDSQTYITKRAFLKTVFNDNTSIEDRIKRIENVSTKDIEKVLSLIELDTTYVLYGGII